MNLPPTATLLDAEPCDYCGALTTNPLVRVTNDAGEMDFLAICDDCGEERAERELDPRHRAWLALRADYARFAAERDACSSCIQTATEGLTLLCARHSTQLREMKRRERLLAR